MPFLPIQSSEKYWHCTIEIYHQLNKMPISPFHTRQKKTASVLSIKQYGGLLFLIQARYLQQNQWYYIINLLFDEVQKLRLLHMMYSY